MYIVANFIVLLEEPNAFAEYYCNYSEYGDIWQNALCFPGKCCINHHTAFRRLLFTPYIAYCLQHQHYNTNILSLSILNENCSLKKIQWCALSGQGNSINLLQAKQRSA